MTDIASDRDAAIKLADDALERLQVIDPGSEVIELWEQRATESCTEEIMRRFGNLNFQYSARENKTLVAHIYAGLYLAVKQASIWADVQAEKEVEADRLCRNPVLMELLAEAVRELTVLDESHELVELFRDRKVHKWFNSEIFRRFRPRNVPAVMQVKLEPDERCFAMMFLVTQWEIKRLVAKAA